ncbi:hypothetical protein GEV33_004407 [Tenebrio molitor]|uniref:Kinesin motor domain-containing protein n=1 Tax=Tenebrio molitor TaxID=7067 RepID=A0A8J6HPE7_TENMO|nr:hypothetical protein GEV33_004407 [Tenebrio molitor]
MVQREANLVLKSLRETKTTTDELLECETLSLVSNDDDSEQNSANSVNYRTYHKSWGLKKNVPVIEPPPPAEDCPAQASQEEDKSAKPKIVKPLDKPAEEEPAEEEPQGKAIRGRRKPLYSKTTSKIAPKAAKTPIRNMTSNLVRNVTSSIKSVKQATKPPPATKPPTPQSRTSSGYGTKSSSPKTSPARTAPKPKLERQGTFTKEEPKSRIPTPGSAKAPSRIPARSFNSASSDRTTRTVKTTYGRSTSADSTNRRMPNSGSNQSLKGAPAKRASIPMPGQRSGSNTSLNSNGTSTKKQVTSKIASLWKKIEESKNKQPAKKDTRVWIQSEGTETTGLTRSNTFDNKNGVTMRNKTKDKDDGKRVSRPMCEKEKQADCTRVVNVYSNRGVIEVENPKARSENERNKIFTYDAVYDWNASQQCIYDETVRPLVSSVLEGYNGCVFAYGQTGTGKTYTMEGTESDEDNLGVIPRAFQQIWTHINRTTGLEFLVTVRYLEIYMEDIRSERYKAAHVSQAIHPCRDPLAAEDLGERGREVVAVVVEQVVAVPSEFSPQAVLDHVHFFLREVGVADEDGLSEAELAFHVEVLAEDLFVARLHVEDAGVGVGVAPVAELRAVHLDAGVEYPKADVGRVLVDLVHVVDVEEDGFATFRYRLVGVDVLAQAHAGQVAGQRFGEHLTGNGVDEESTDRPRCRDLLKIKNSKSLELREINGKGVCVTHLHSQTCQSADDMLRAMRIGNKNRTSGATNMNEHSSRSHAIFQIAIEMAELHSKSVKVGKLNLVDLAGSERQSKTGATGDRFKEATKINKALSSLGNVIYALAENSQHIPYRDSKLTRLLQDSLGGNSKTIMIANIGPANVNYEETIITLRYAYRAKSIKNQPIKNEDIKDAKLLALQEEIARLKELIEMKASGVECEVAFEESDTSDDDGDSKKDESKKKLELGKMEVDELAQKLQTLEKQMVHGGKNIVDSVNENEVRLEQQKMEVAARKKREIEMQQKIELEEETCFELKQVFASLQQQVDFKREKMKRLYAKLQSVRQEIKDNHKIYMNDRKEIEEANDDASM